MHNEYISKLEIKNSSKESKNVGGLKGIDKILIINLKGSTREAHMRNEMKKITTIVEGIDWEFVRPLNIGIGDVTIDELIERKILPKDKKILSHEMTKNGEYNIGTVSLAMVTYSLFLRSCINNEIYLILEDNVVLNENFVDKYNTFYNNLPNDEWNMLDLHSFDNIKYTQQCKDYYTQKKSNTPGLNSIQISDEIGKNIDKTVRAKVNEYVSVGCNEGAGSKAIVIKPTALLFISPMPIIAPSDGVKNWISGYWNVGLSFVPRNEFIKVSEKILSDRRGVDEGSTNFVKLDATYVKNFLDTLETFTHWQIKYTYEAYKIYNMFKIDGIKINSPCINYNISILYNDLTLQLCNKNLNANASILNAHLDKYYKNIDMNKFYKLNPSIVDLNDSHFLMCYRIYIGKLGCEKYDLKNCHPWKDMWASSIFDINGQISKLNYLGLCIINKNTFKVEKDTLLNISDGPLGIEDVRLFKHADEIYLAGAVTVGRTGEFKGMWKDDRILKQMIGKIGKTGDVLKALPVEMTNIDFNCINAHESNMEKNWFGYMHDKKHIIVNPTFGNFFPLKKYLLNLTNKVAINETRLDEQYSHKNGYNCDKLDSINENNFIEQLNEYYGDVTDGQLFRLSGGSWGVPYKNKILFIGHIVVYVNNLNMEKVKKYLETNGETQKSQNLFHFVKKREHQLTFFMKTMRYYSVFFMIDPITNKISDLSNCFNIFKNAEEDTSVNFPIGLIAGASKTLISFGESDSKTVVVSMDNQTVDKLFTDASPENYKFLSFDSNGKLICYNNAL